MQHRPAAPQHLQAAIGGCAGQRPSPLRPRAVCTVKPRGALTPLSGGTLCGVGERSVGRSGTRHKASAIRPQSPNHWKCVTIVFIDARGDGRPGRAACLHVASPTEPPTNPAAAAAWRSRNAASGRDFAGCGKTLSATVPRAGTRRSRGGRRSLPASNTRNEVSRRQPISTCSILTPVAVPAPRRRSPPQALTLCPAPLRRPFPCLRNRAFQFHRDAAAPRRARRVRPRQDLPMQRSERCWHGSFLRHRLHSGTAPAMQ